MKDDPLRGSRYKAFRKFHRVNPHVFVKFVEFARVPLDEGFDHFSGHAVSERVRWYGVFETVSDDKYMLSNNHVPYLGRLLMNKYDEFAGFFKTRGQNYDTTDEILLAECGTALSLCEECGQPIYLDHICWEDCDE